MQEKRESLLLNLEEVLALEDTILRQVGTVDSILDSVTTKFGSQGAWPKILGDLGVHWPAQLSE